MLSDNYKEQFEPELIKAIEQHASSVHFKAGAIIIDIGQPVKTMPLILNGVIKVSRMSENGDELLLYYVNANESCAMTFTCCMQNFPSEIKATAETDVDLLAIPVNVMDEWIVKFPTWKSFIMRTIRTRFKELLQSIDDIAFYKMDDRLVHYLKEKAKHTGSSLINLSHEQIASELATSRVVISRLLKSLENQKKVLLYRNQIKLLNAL